jgi:hypothetical protein
MLRMLFATGATSFSAAIVAIMGDLLLINRLRQRDF